MEDARAEIGRLSRELKEKGIQLERAQEDNATLSHRNRELGGTTRDLQQQLGDAQGALEALGTVKGELEASGNVLRTQSRELRIAKEEIGRLRTLLDEERREFGERESKLESQIRELQLEADRDEYCIERLEGVIKEMVGGNG